MADTIKMNNYDTIQCLGKGAFGEAMLVKSTNNGQQCVIKIIDKSQVSSCKDTTTS